MNLKKVLFKFIIAVLLITYCAPNTFAAPQNHLGALGITEETLSYKEDTDLITRGEFSCIVSKLLTKEAVWPSDTAFSDVTKEYAYSGEIKLLSDLGVIGGDGSGMFNPEGTVSTSAGMKIILHILGYGSVSQTRGGYPVGYELVANDLGLYKDVKSQNGMLTKEAAFRLVYNALLTSDGNGSTTILSGDKVIYEETDKDEIFLTDRLGFSVYRGEIAEADCKSSNISFRVDKNEFKSNRVIQSVGSTVKFTVKSAIDIALYEHVPVLLWVDDNDEVVCIDVMSGYEILYGYIDSVNRDMNENSTYQINKLNYISLQDNPDEYDVDENITVWYNGARVVTDVKLCGSFSKLVVKSGVIVSVCAWSMTDGGLITEVDATKGIITYIQAETGTRKLKELKETDFLSVNIDGRSADFKEIKPNSVFSYYKSENETVIAISEQTSIGVLKTVSNTNIQIDTISYGRKECYFSVDGIDYIKDDFSELLGKEVCVFFGPDCYATFVRAENKVSEKPNFYAAVVGIEGKPLDEEYDIMLYVLGEKTYKDVYAVTEKTKYHDGLNIDTLKNNAKKTDGSGVYYFEVDEDKEIRLIKECKPFAGYENNNETTVTSFVEGNIPYVAMGDKILYFTKSNIMGIYENENGFAAKRIQWSDVAGLNVKNGVKLCFYGEKETPYPELVIMTENLSAIRSRSVKFGVVTKKIKTLDENGDIVNRIAVLSGKGSLQYDLTETLANELYEGAFISYYDGRVFAEDIIELRSIYNLSGKIDLWNTDATSTYGLQKGVVRKIDEARLYVTGENGDAIWFMHPSLSFSMSATERADGNMFKQTAFSDIEVGDTVFYFVHSGDIRVIISVE